jgi:hypothetical protein
MSTPDQLALPTLDGETYPDGRLALSRSIELDAALLSDYVIGGTYEITIRATCISKRFAVKTNTAGETERLLTVTLAAERLLAD